MRCAERRKVNVLEEFGGWYKWIELRMKRCLEVLEYKGRLVSRVDQRVLKWFGYVEIIDEYRMAEVEGGYRVDQG